MINQIKTISYQSGFLLPAAIFLLVVLAGLGAYAVNINAIQLNASTQNIQGVRAYHAARAGIEWAAHEIIQTSPLTITPACPSATLSIESFSVVVSCSASDHVEQGGDNQIRLYEVESTATFGTVNTQNYIERKINISLSKCVSNSSSLCQ